MALQPLILCVCKFTKIQRSEVRTSNLNVCYARQRSFSVKLNLQNGNVYNVTNPIMPSGCDRKDLRGFIDTK